MTVYPHLDPAVQAHADLPNRERIEHIRVDRWIDYPRARQALDKLQVPWEPSAAERDYNAGRTTQVPMRPRVRLRSGRFSRKLRYNGMELAFDR